MSEQDARVEERTRTWERAGGEMIITKRDGAEYLDRLVADPQRFWSKVDRRGPDECWPWMGSRNRWGYGRAGNYLKKWNAHRVAYFLARGAFPSKGVTMHSCDNPPCCNPAHLIDGTVGENTRDAARQGKFPGPRHRKGPDGRFIPFVEPPTAPASGQ